MSIPPQLQNTYAQHWEITSFAELVLCKLADASVQVMRHLLCIRTITGGVHVCGSFLDFPPSVENSKPVEPRLPAKNPTPFSPPCYVTAPSLYHVDTTFSLTGVHYLV